MPAGFLLRLPHIGALPQLIHRSGHRVLDLGTALKPLPLPTSQSSRVPLAVLTQRVQPSKARASSGACQQGSRRSVVRDVMQAVPGLTYMPRAEDAHRGTSPHCTSERAP